MDKRKVAALLAEFIGTFTLVLVVLNVSRYGLPLFTALAAGITVVTFTSVVGRISGGHFNPAITLGLFSLRKVSFVRTISYLVAQVVGALAAWQLYEFFTDRALKNTSTSFDWKIFVAEVIGAAIFGLAFAAVISQKLEGYQAAVSIGMGLFLGLTVAGLASTGILNPAVAIGVRSFDVNYFLGPVVGVLVGMNLFMYAMSGEARKVKAVATATVAKVTKAKKSPAKKKAPAKKKK